MAAQPVAIVDWDSVKEELDAIDDSWKQPRFDSLAHVVEALTSQNPEEATRTLREQRDAIEALVDDVVRGYHKGFNKAIHNYSQILKLFSDSATSLSGLKVQLTDCKQLLGSKHKQLQQQWYRSITLRNVIGLLDQIDNVAQVPAKMESLISEKRYYAAVQLHIQSISMLEREGIHGVGALQDVRAELSKLREALFTKVVEDLHSHLYNKGEYSTVVVTSQAADDDLSNVESVVPSINSLHPVSRRTKSIRRSEVASDGRRNGSLNGTSLLSEEDGLIQNGDATDDNAHKHIARAKWATPIFLAGATPNEFVEGVKGSNASLNVKYLQTMVECLNMLGKTAAGGSIISQRLRQTIHDIITDEIKNRAASMQASNPRVEVSKLSLPHRNGSFLPASRKSYDRRSTIRHSMVENAPSMGPTGPAQAPARELIRSVLDALVRVLENHVAVGEALAGTSIDAQASDDDTRTTGGYNLALTFSIVQNECQQLICDILRVSADAAATDAAQTARFSSKAPAADKSNGSLEKGLSFAFRLTDAMSIPGSEAFRPVRPRNSGVPEGYWTGSVLAERGMYLIAALYRPTLEFADRLLSLLPEKHAHLAKEGLQKFIESFIKDQFLPMIVVDYRTRVADALASTAAFRPKPYSSFEVIAEKTRIALLGPSIADQLATEVVTWARAMPKYAAEFLELVQTILERTLERCRAVYTETVLGALSSSIIGRVDVEKLMKQETANALIEEGAGEHGDNGEDMEVEMELNNMLLSLRPIRQDQLIKEDQKFVLLAALSESLDGLAASILLLGENTFQGQQKKEQRRASSPLISGLHDLMSKCRSLSLECLRTLRIEMQLQAVFHLQSMSGRVYVSDLDAEEPEDFIVTFTTQITRWDEEMSHYVPSAKRNYIFGGICGVAATAFIKALNDMSLVNVFGVRQICRNCIALQQALAALSSTNGELVQQQLDRVRTYYELLTMPFEALVAFVAEHQSIFSLAEFSNLLKVNVPGREVPPDGFQRIARLLAP